jgi:hypothetical protein
MTAKERRQKKRYQKKGLLWSDSEQVRADAWKAGFRSVAEASELSDAEKEQLWDSFWKDRNWAALTDLVSEFAGSTEAKEEAYRQGWNAVIRASRQVREQVEEAITPAAPRKQVSMDKAGELPQAVKDRLAKQQEKSEVPAWLIPALGLALVVFLWRK